MIKSKAFIIYLVVLAVFALLGWVVIQQGFHLEDFSTDIFETDAAGTNLTQSFWDQLVHGFMSNLHHPLAVFIIQLVIIVFVARIFGFLFTKIRQPSVVGEIVAGIVLGPSLAGIFFPQFSAFVFPPESLPFLQYFSQIGLMLFMFIIGMEVDIKTLKNRAFDALIISHTGIVFSFFLGVVLAYFLYSSFAPDNVGFTAFALFMGIIFSTTAFPVLARIIQERGLTKTHFGVLAITTAAIDDMTAWCLLAVIIAVVKSGGFANSLTTIVLTVTYIFIMLKIVQPFLKRFGTVYVSKENLNKTVVAFVFVVLLFSSYVTEVIGIHPLVGAFIAGVIMPHNINFKKIITEKIEDVSLVLLLPLFFVFTGLRTELNLLSKPELWMASIIVIAVAIAGKFFGAAIPAKLLKHNWKDSLSMGVIMNARGLIGFIFLNIGYDLGIFGKEIFTILVLMALLTTFIANPMLEFIGWAFDKFGRKETIAEDASGALNILLSFGPSKTGSALLRLANFISGGEKEKRITAMHLTPSLEISPHDALIFEKEAFGPVRLTAHELKISFTPKYKAVDDVEKEIQKTANQGNYDLLLMGSAKSPFTEKITGGKIKSIMEGVYCSVGILVDNNFRDPENILILLNGKNDTYLANYALRFVEPGRVKTTLLDINGTQEISQEIRENSSITIEKNKEMDKLYLSRFQLVVVDLEYWKDIADRRTKWISYSPSLLIFSKEKERK